MHQLSGPRALTLGCLFGVLFWAAILLGVCAVSEADEPADPYTEAAIAQWSGVSGATFNDLIVHVAPLLEPVYYPGQTAQAWVSPNGHCEVRLDPVYWPALTYQGRQNVVTHELGHCLGLAHTTVPGVMYSPLFFDFSPADGAYARTLWPLPYQVLVDVAVW